MQDLIDIYNKTKYLYEKHYDIHICGFDEIEDVVDFIDKYWQKGHIFTKSRVLLDWQHKDKTNGRYNFIIARFKKTGEIHGLIGFILSSIYDSEIATPIRWGAIWKIRDDVAVKGLGLALKGFMELNVPTHFVGGIGLSKYSKAIDTKLGEKMGKLTQYYIANPNVKDYKLIDRPVFADSQKLPISEKDFVILDEGDLFKSASEINDYMMPYKSAKYYINRYLNHPVYEYKLIAVRGLNGSTLAIFVYRVCHVEDRNSLFVVDYIGQKDAFCGCYKNFIELLENEEAESLSFPCEGIGAEYLKNAGFMRRDDSDVILPVYYEPFVLSNIELDYHFWTDGDFSNAIIVKGDADQDRPNRLGEKTDD